MSPLKTFKITILDNELTMMSAMDLLGYSHITPPRKEPVSYYPFEELVRDVIIKSKTMRSALQNARRTLIGFRHIEEHTPRIRLTPIQRQRILLLKRKQSQEAEKALP